MPPFDSEGSTSAQSRSGPRAGGGFAFGPYRLLTRPRQLMRGAAPVVLPSRHYDVLHLLVRHRGDIVTKQQIAEAGWGVVAISDASIEKLMSQLRTILDPHNRTAYIVNFSRQGYRMAAAVTTMAPAVDIDDTLEPYRAWMRGRGLLESFDRHRVAAGRDIFEELVRRDALSAPAHVGLATACIMQFEAQRATIAPDSDALVHALDHARTACGLDDRYAAAWSIYGFVLQRSGDCVGSMAALRRAIELDPDNWLHHLMLAYCSWGDDRLRAVHHVLTRSPGLPAAHALAVMVYIARGAFNLAATHLNHARAASPDDVALGLTAAPLDWLESLLCFVTGRKDEGFDMLARELAREGNGYLYAHEVCAQACYTKGSVHYLDGNYEAAGAAFAETLTRVPRHPLALVGLAMVARKTPPGSRAGAQPGDHASAQPFAFERRMAEAVLLVDEGRHADAATLLCAALDAAPPGNAGWLIPVDPLLQVQSHKTAFARTLARLHARARLWLPAQ